MILCPTLTPPLSAIPPLNKLQIWNNEKCNVRNRDIGDSYHSVLDAEAELILGVGSLDLDLHHGRTRHGRQFDSSFVLTVL